jgi:hypothetical protein
MVGLSVKDEIYSHWPSSLLAYLHPFLGNMSQVVTKIVTLDLLNLVFFSSHV